MKKIASILFTVAFVAFAAVSCADKKDQSAPKAGMKTVEIIAQVVDANSKTTITPGESEFESAWSEGDKIRFAYVAPDGTTGTTVATWSEGRFTASLPAQSGAWSYSDIYANTTEAGVASLPFRRTQTGAAFSGSHDLMRVAKADEPSFTAAAAGCDNDGKPVVFKMTRETAVLYYHLSSENTAEVTYAILTVDGDPIASSDVKYSDGALALGSGKGGNTITVALFGAVANDLTLWFNVLPGNYSKVKLTLVDAEGKTASITKSASGSNVAGKLYKASKTVTWEENTIPTGLTEDFSSSKATNNTYACSSAIATGANRSNFDYMWTCDKGSVFKNGIKIGTSDSEGTITNTDMLANVNAGVEFTVYVYSAAWASDVNTLDVTYNGTTKSAAPANLPIYWTSEEYNAGDFLYANSFTFTKVAAVNEIKFASSAKRILIDRIIIAYTQVDKTAQTLSFPQSSYTVRIGESFTAPALSGAQTRVTYSSSNTAAATVDASTGAVTIVGTGSTTITATAAEDETYRAASASYKLDVLANVVSLPYTESFSSGIGDCVIEDITLPSGLSYVWKHDASNQYMKASAYSSSNSTNYKAKSQIVTPTLDLSGQTAASLSFDLATRYGPSADKYPELFYVNIYNGTSWTKHTVPNFSDGSSWTFMSNTIDLSAYCGKQIQIALVYDTTEQTASPTLEVKNLSVMAGTTEISATDQTIKYGSTSKKVIYTTNSDGAVSYSSSNKNIVTVASDGTITTKGVGEATVTVSVAASSTYPAASATCKITVEKGNNPADFAVFDVHVYETGQFQTSCALGNIGETFTGQTLAGATNYRSDCEYFSVDSDGTVSNFQSIGSAQTQTGMVYADLAETSLYEAKRASYRITIHYFKFDLGIEPNAVNFHKNGGTADVALSWVNFHTSGRFIKEVKFSGDVPDSLSYTFSDNFEKMTISCPRLSGSEWSVTATVTVKGYDNVTHLNLGEASASFTISQDNKSDRVLKTYTMTFNSETMQSSVTNYTSSWTAKAGDFSLTIQNWNNNGKGWSYIKAGRKGYVSVATIKTAAAIAEDMKQVSITIDAVTATKINSLMLFVASDSAFSSDVQELSFKVEAGTQSVTIANPVTNAYYKIVADCQSGASNGLITISKIVFTNEVE